MTDIVWRHKPRLAVVVSEARVAILDLDHLAQPAQVLEGSAAAIWRAVDGECSTSKVAASVAAEFEVKPSRVESDVVIFLNTLASHGLLEEVT